MCAGDDVLCASAFSKGEILRGAVRDDKIINVAYALNRAWIRIQI